jgi:ArsR family transcriptional regulator, arsenate/arsenite/antimonite-responsive transcriptional repressor
MNTKETAECLAELGHETRLLIFRFLVKMGKDGVAVGDIQKELQIPNSTLSHHISKLTKVGLVTQTRDGRTLYCQPQYKRLQSLLDFLMAECCQGQSCLEVNSCSETFSSQN